MSSINSFLRPERIFALSVLIACFAVTTHTQSALDGFDPNANGEIEIVVVQPDGKILIDGVTFEFSTENVNYAPLGSTASRNSWILSGLNLPSGYDLYIRARGFYLGGEFEGWESNQQFVRNTFLDGPTSTPTLTPPNTATNTPTATPTDGPGCTPGAWAMAAPYPLAVYGAATVTDGTFAYTFGGHILGGATFADSNRYDPFTNTWTPIAPIASGADYLFRGEYGGNGKIYLMGGLTGGTLNRIYDITGNSWSTGAAIPSFINDQGHVVFGGKIFVIGGRNASGVSVNTVYAYDIASNTWATRAPLPQAEFNMACGVINGKIYCAGGSNESGVLNNLYVYDIAGNSWSSGPPMEVPANFAAGTVVSGKLWVIGGGNPFRPAEHPKSLTNTQVYDPLANTWVSSEVLNHARSFADAVTLNVAGGQTALIVAGYDSTAGNAINSVETNTSGCFVSGTVTYGNAIGAPTPRFVSNVLLSGAGSVPVAAFSGFPSGTYSLSGFGSGAYTVTPSKTGGVGASITSFDAGRVSQHVAGINTLTGNQLIVADVSGNGTLSSFDAGQTARYVAGVPGSGSTANWIFLPAIRNYASVTGNIAGEDFIALLMGEVSGNWTNTGAKQVTSR